MTVEELQRLAAAYQAEHPQQRWGQALFNTLCRVDPGLGRELTGTGADPFYSDSRVGDFLVAIENRTCPPPSPSRP